MTSFISSSIPVPIRNDLIDPLAKLVSFVRYLHSSVVRNFLICRKLFFMNLITLVAIIVIVSSLSSSDSSCSSSSLQFWSGGETLPKFGNSIFFGASLIHQPLFNFTYGFKLLSFSKLDELVIWLTNSLSSKILLAVSVDVSTEKCGLSSKSVLTLSVDVSTRLQGF